ncbi:enhanced serine sensitivity protein SseB C-terminal domain-containing protein [Paenibacillus pini]|uniref:SseB protein N-terminal domain-containing protein n=1 Tax=Paenibacillus pini JCM 16418 TaxID=1236976 RepID=W7Y5R1_9BACL|nr:enhanced serine sensitivity protein SseB C-terminal domain-containing protein [Paenibacillus pini]GAF06105.1 hypothetical protein JCM16418_48 [Paenibacillus pini JCM 16418]
MSSQPQNELELKLIKAFEDASARADFYIELQKSQIYAIQGNGPETVTKEKTLSQGETVQLLNIEGNGKIYIPIFSSITRMQEFIQEEVHYLSMNAKELFQLTKGADLLLNPGSEFGKEFSSGEIESILNGAVFNAPESYVVEKDTNVMIGQPTTPPVELLNGLRTLFATLSQVECAYNAQVYNPKTDEKPHTLIAIRFNGGGDELIAAAGRVTESVSIPDPPVDYVQLDGNSGLESYFEKECMPFYQK